MFSKVFIPIFSSISVFSSSFLADAFHLSYVVTATA